MKKWIVIIVVCILAMVVLALIIPNDAEAQRAKKLGLEAYHEQRFDVALTNFDTYLETHAEDTTAWIYRGNALLNLDRLAEAETSYLTALKLDNRNVRALNAMGVLYRRREDLDKAVEYYQRALAIRSDYVPTHLCLATIEMERGNAEQTLKHAQRAYDLTPDDPTAAAYLAIAFHMNGKMEDRDRLTKAAKELGYAHMDRLAKFYEKRTPQAPPTEPPVLPENESP